jgi:hypothetical protein
MNLSESLKHTCGNVSIMWFGFIKDKEAVRNYIKHQEEEDKRIEQLSLF